MSARLTERELLAIAHLLGAHYAEHPEAPRLVARIRAHVDSLPFPTRPKESS